MSTLDKTVQEFLQIFEEAGKKGTSPYDTQAEVKRVEDGIAWVHIAGGVDETPVKLTVNAKAGDIVQVRVSGGQAFLIGNATAPPTDDSIALQAIESSKAAKRAAIQAEKDAKTAQTAATQAQSDAQAAHSAAIEAIETAESVHDIAVQAQEDAEAATTAAGQATQAANNASNLATQAQSAAQAANTAAGQAQSDAQAASAAAGQAQTAATQAQNNLKSVVQGASTVEKAVSVMQTALEAIVDYDPTEDEVQEYFWHDANGAHVLGDTSGYRNDISSTGMKIVDTDTETTVGEFGEIVTLGKDDESHVEIDYHSMQLVDKEGEVYFWVSDLRDRDDDYLATITERFVGDGVTETFNVNCAVSEEVSAIDSSHPSNTYLREYNQYTFNIAPSNGAIITITYKTQDRIAKAYTLGMRRSGTHLGALSLSEGINTEASGTYSHSEGYNTTANMSCAHAEGSGTIASGVASHAEGKLATASGDYSHAEGDNSIASGASSHAEGMNTVASGSQSHAGGDHTIAQGMDQTVIGMYNIPMGSSHQLDIGDPLFIIGNGFDDSNRSNAFTVDWNGNVNIPAGGKYKINGSNLSASHVGAVPTTRTVNGKPLSANVSDADYITSQSAASGWYYRKWKSGRVEAWGILTFSARAGSAWGSFYYSDIDVSIPSGIFSEAPIRAYATGSNFQWWCLGVTISSATACKVRMVKPVSSSQAGGIYLYLFSA